MVAMQKEQKEHSEEHSSLDTAHEIKFLLRTFRLTSKVPLDTGEGSSHLIESLLAALFAFHHLFHVPK